MKRPLLNTFLLLALAAGKTNAQVKDNLSFGPIIGIGHTTISGEIKCKKEIQPALNIGMRVIRNASPQLGFDGDIRFRTEGAKVGSTTSGQEIRLHANYMRLDLKAYYFFGEPGQSFRPKICMGPSLGFLLGG